MNSTQFGQITGGSGFDIIPADGTLYDGNWYCIQFLGVQDGSDVTINTIDNGIMVLSNLSKNIPNGYILFGRFVEVTLNNSGAIVAYRIDAPYRTIT